MRIGSILFSLGNQIGFSIVKYSPNLDVFRKIKLIDQLHNYAMIIYHPILQIPIFQNQNKIKIKFTINITFQEKSKQHTNQKT